MHELPFSLPGTFLRGNLHGHSNRSDGALAPEAVCRLYRSLGYDFVALTDHFLDTPRHPYGHPVTDTSAYRTPTFTTLLGAELHGGSIEFGSPWHLVAVGLPPDFPPFPLETPGIEILRLAREAGAFTIVAHPSWYGLTEADLDQLGTGTFDAMEVYNGSGDDGNDSGENAYFADVALGRGREFSLVATDDSHIVGDTADVARGWVMVKAETREPEAILRALKAGAFYSSTGPLVHDVRIEGTEVVVSCSPAERIFLTGQRPDGVQTSSASGLREARLSFAGFRSDWARVTVRDRNGGRAWTNPFRIPTAS